MKAWLTMFVLTLCSVAFADTNGPDPSRDRDPLDQGNDNCPATVIPSLPYTDTGTTAGRADNFSFCGASPAPDVVYQFVTPNTGDYTISLCGSSYNTRIALNTGGGCPGNTQIYCADNECGVQSRVNTMLAGGLTYYIIVDGAPGSLGNYVLNVSRDATCDTCEADSCPATIIPSLPYTDIGTTIGRNHNWVLDCSGSLRPDLIYTLVTASNGPITASLCNSDIRCQLEVRTGGACPGSTTVNCNFFSCLGLKSALTFQATAWVTYYIIVKEASGGASGQYILDVFETCDVVSQPGDIIECAETPGPSHQTQDCNGGCDNASWGGTPFYQPLQIGQSFFGRSFTYQGTQILNDRDWFTFSVAESCTVKVEVEAEFEWTLLIEPAGCPVQYWQFGGGPPCIPRTHVDPLNHATFPPGSYLLRFEYAQYNYNSVPVPLDYRLTLECIPSHVPCMTCQPLDIIHCADIPDSTNFTNDCNGGCRVEPDRFQNISCGQIVCGVGFTYLRSDGSYRDTDWYLFTLAETSLVNVQVFADFEVDIGISRAVDCPFGFFMTGVGDTCETLSVTSQNCLAPGNYILLVEPFWFSGMPTPRPYRVTLNCGPCANCPADAVITAPGTYSSNTCGEGDDCVIDQSQQFDIEDRFVRVNIPQPGIWQFSLCSSLEPWNSFLYLMTDCCNPNSILVQDNNGCGASGLSLTPCINLTTGTYYVLVESDPNDNFQCSNEFTLTVTPCDNPCPPVDSLTIERFEESSVFLNFYLPTPGFVRFYLATNKTSEFPTGFNLIDSFRANTAGRYDHYEIFAPGSYGRYVATLDSCGQ